MLDLVALGELLIDFTPAGQSASGNALFERNPGGAPANVVAALTKLGGSGAFIGKVGNDQFGHFLREVLAANRIDTRGLRFSAEANTTLAFVHLDERGDRSFTFYRKLGADSLLRVEDLDLQLIDEAKIFHFGSVSLTHEPARSATLAAARYAKENGKLVSYDPNWRPPLWESEAAAKEGMSLGLRYADLVKLSEVELEFLTGEPHIDRGSGKLAELGISLVVVTLGPKGCYYRSPRGTGHLPTYDTRVVDTTGAGDAFLGGLLFQLSGLDRSPAELDPPVVTGILKFANAVGALCAAKRGAIPAMPSMEEVNACLRDTPRLILA